MKILVLKIGGALAPLSDLLTDVFKWTIELNKSAPYFSFAVVGGLCALQCPAQRRGSSDPGTDRPYQKDGRGIPQTTATGQNGWWWDIKASILVLTLLKYLNVNDFGINMYTYQSITIPCKRKTDLWLAWRRTFSCQNCTRLGTLTVYLCFLTPAVLISILQNLKALLWYFSNSVKARFDKLFSKKQSKY